MAATLFGSVSVDESKSITENLKRYIVDNKQLEISARDWAEFNKAYSKEDLREAIISLIYDGSIGMPMRHITSKECAQTFLSLRELPVEGRAVGDCYGKYEYKQGNPTSFFEGASAYNKASDYFNQDARFKCAYVNKPSCYELWTDKDKYKFLKTVIDGLWAWGYEDVNTANIKTCVRTRNYLAMQFRPAAAREIYSYYGAKNILDFSAGWGDRLCGFYATPTAESYIGIDPNVAVYENYHKQDIFYSKLIGKKNTMFLNMPAEEVGLPPEIVDFVFTSPPYFNCEIYTRDDTQSENRYDNLKNWLDGFLKPTLSMAYYALKPGGIIALNISDFADKNGRVCMCDPMNDFFRDELKMEFVECSGFRISARYQSAIKHQGEAHTEPLWVWRKPTEGTLTELKWLNPNRQIIDVNFGTTEQNARDKGAFKQIKLF